MILGNDREAYEEPSRKEEEEIRYDECEKNFVHHFVQSNLQNAIISKLKAKQAQKDDDRRLAK